MQSISERIASANWSEVAGAMRRQGFAIVQKLFTDAECEAFKENYTNPDAYRKTVVMERHRFGSGEYKYFDYPLPELLHTTREKVYARIAGIANEWMEVLHIDKQFPGTHSELLQQCHDNGQMKATVLILKYGKGGHNTLHQDLYGDIFFPMQAVLFLSEAGKDYTGGEFVLTEQTPRAQSKAIVLQPGKGDMLIFTTNFRPVKSSKGYYRATMKHGVSEVSSGERYTLGIIFHDAVN